MEPSIRPRMVPQMFSKMTTFGTICWPKCSGISGNFANLSASKGNVFDIFKKKNDANRKNVFVTKIDKTVLDFQRGELKKFFKTSTISLYYY